MNEPRSARYQRLNRRARQAGSVLWFGLLALLALSDAGRAVRAATGGSPAAYALALLACFALAWLPLSWYRACVLDRQYRVADVPVGAWFRDRVKGLLVAAVAAPVAAELTYAAIAAFPGWWWLVTGAGAGLLLAAAAWLAPLLVVPFFHDVRPLARPDLRARLAALSARAGVPVVDAHELRLGPGTRRASAALVGVGAGRRILLSDTLLDDYTDDEIEVILAHEMGHHANRDLLKSLAAEIVVLLLAFAAADRGLAAFGPMLGLSGPSDTAGLPLVVMAIGAVLAAASPVLNLLSRRSERRADAFALRFASRPDAFVRAVRRMAAQNLVDERPSRAALWLFHRHPAVEERIHAATRRRA